MRILFAALIAATPITAIGVTTAPASAQNPNREYRQDVREAKREYRDDIRDAKQDRREDTRDWRRFRNYDYNRLPAGQRVYYADRFYRDGRYYRPVRLNRNSRIYRGGNGRYYCRRSDGTTGLIIGGISGAAIGAALSNGRSTTLGALIGGAGGALLGQSIDRGQVNCR